MGRKEEGSEGGEKEKGGSAFISFSMQNTNQKQLRRIYPGYSLSLIKFRTRTEAGN